MFKSKSLLGLSVALGLGLASQSAHSFGWGWGPKFCQNPVAAVKNTLKCVGTFIQNGEESGSEDAECAAAGYNPEFVKLHNGVEVPSVPGQPHISDPAFWSGAFQILDLTLEVDHEKRVSRDVVSIRYVETVDVGIPEFGIVFPPIYQHEHALVTVDKDCKMVLWDQYGDNKEQTDVDATVGQLLEIIGQAPAAPAQ